MLQRENVSWRDTVTVDPHGRGMRLASLLSRGVIKEVLRSNETAYGSAVHHVHSMDRLMRRGMVRSLTEKPELLAVSPLVKAMNLVETVHVHVDRPYTRRSSGLYEPLDPASASMTRNTYSSPFVVDLLHTSYTPLNRASGAHWEGKNAGDIDLLVQQVEEAYAANRPLPSGATGGSYVVAGENKSATKRAAQLAEAALLAVSKLPEAERRRLMEQRAGVDGDAHAAACSEGPAEAAAAARAQAHRQAQPEDDPAPQPKPQPQPQPPGPPTDGISPGDGLGDAPAGRVPPPGPRVRLNLDPTQSGARVRQVVYRQQNKFSMPTMVGSAVCRSIQEAPCHPNDPDSVQGQFVIKGTSRTMALQRRLHNNRVYVLPSSNPQRFLWMAEMRAVNSNKMRSTSTLKLHVRCDSNGTGPLRGAVEMAYIKDPVPVLAVAMVLGFSCAEEVAVSAATHGALSGLRELPTGHPAFDTPACHATFQWVLSLLRDEEVEPFETWPRSRTLAWIGERGDKKKQSSDKAKYAAHLTANELLPNAGLSAAADTVARKGDMLACLLAAVADVARHLSPPDDYDHAGNRQYDTNGVMCGNFGRQLDRRANKQDKFDMKRLADSERHVNVGESNHSKRITDAFNYAMATGNWGIQKGGSTQTGLTQITSHANKMATVSHVRKVDAPLKRESNHAKPRMIHVSSFGMTCPVETPEGASCGLVEQLAQGAWVCQGHDTSGLMRAVAGVLARQTAARYVLVAGDGVATGECVKLRAPSSLKRNEARAPPDLDFPPAVAAALEAGRAAVRAAVTSWACVPWRILINGVPLAYVADGGQTAALLRTARRSACIPFDVAVEENPHRRTVSVTGDPGGLRRPLLRLDWDHASGNPLGGVLDALAATAGLPSEALWRDLRRRGAVEYLSKHEEENMTVLESPCEEGVMAWGVTSAQDLPRTHTHCEVHPSMALGAVAASLHFCTFDQSCRSTYFTANKKQVSAAMAPDLTGNAGMKAWYAQAPYTTTWSGSLRRFPPCSVNLLVGVLPLESQNEEDSLVVNADTVARGALHVSMINGFSEDCSAAAQYAHLSRPAGGSSSLLAVTPSGVPRRTPLDTPLGLAPPMSHLRPGDVLIVNSLAGEAGQGGAPSLADDAQTTMDDDGLAAAGPVGGDDDADMGGGHLEDGGGVPGAAPAPARMQGVRDKSALVPAGLGPVEVRDAYVVRGRDNKRLHHSTVVSVRSLAVADKLSSSHGQKGVDGALIPARYMPVTADGQALDIIVNTHAFPSRMTPGQFVEAIAGYACAVTGTTVDATPFNGVDLKALQDKLGGRGPGDPAVGATVSPTCQHVLYSGVTGKRMQGTVFVGVVSYFRLKQMVVDKHHARAQGPNDAKTGGPMDGRAKEGGLRFGEMERDCVQGAGAANVALDRLQYQSDVFLWPVCRMCGKGAMNAAPPGLTAASFNAHAPYCNRCGVPGTVTRVVAPYATKLLFAELSAMGVRVAMDVEEEAHVNPFASCAVGLPRSVPRERKACVPRSQGPPTYRDPTTGKFDATPEAARDRMLGLLAAGPSLAQTPSRAASDACGPAPQDDADEHMDGPDVVPGAAHTPPSPSQAATQDDQCPDDAAVEDGPPRFAVPPLESALPTRNWAFCRQRQPRGSSLWDDVDALLPPSNLDETTECNSCTTVVKPASRAPRKPRVPAKKRATAR